MQQNNTIITYTSSDTMFPTPYEPIVTNISTNINVENDFFSSLKRIKEIKHYCQV